MLTRINLLTPKSSGASSALTMEIYEFAIAQPILWVWLGNCNITFIA